MNNLKRTYDSIVESNLMLDHRNRWTRPSDYIRQLLEDREIREKYIFTVRVRMSTFYKNIGSGKLTLNQVAVMKKSYLDLLFLSGTFPANEWKELPYYLGVAERHMSMAKSITVAKNRP
jgi:hypothetical protein